MDYPEGSIKSLEELHNTIEVFGASKYFRTVDDKANSLSLTVAHIYDYNVIKLNGYNDWFLFTDEAAAKSYAGVE